MMSSGSRGIFGVGRFVNHEGPPRPRKKELNTEKEEGTETRAEGGGMAAKRHKRHKGQFADSEFPAANRLSGGGWI